MEDGPASSCGAVIRDREGARRVPAGAGQPAGRLRPRPEGFRSKGAGTLPPPEQASPCSPPGLPLASVPQ